MDIRILVIVAVVALATSFSFSQTTQAANDGVAAVVDGSSAFALDLYAKLAAGAKGNLLFSPGSIDTALAMTYAGARGQTADQMAKTLHFNLPADKLHPAYEWLIGQLNHAPSVDVYSRGKTSTQPAYQLVVSNALWGQKGYDFKPDFTQLVAKSYSAAMKDVDFSTDAARQTINKWVADQTKDKIKDLIAPGVLDANTRLVLTNAVYFKSNWANEFEKSATKDGPFRSGYNDPRKLASNSVDVPMMHRKGHYNYTENDDLQALELPYKSRQLSMIILLPRKADGLAALEKSLTAENLAKWLNALNTIESVKVTMPKFTFSGEFSLKDVLTSLGMADAFNPATADFTGMTARKELFISAVIHKAFIAVDEAGTEAAAATAVAMTLSAAPAPQEAKQFNADHPFIFLIRHNPTGEILFLGRVVSPK